jgi:hypothetical protein
MSEEADKPKDVTLVVKCLVKGYHACDFTVEVGEEFVAKKKLISKLFSCCCLFKYIFLWLV